MRPERQVFELKELEKGIGFLSRDGWSLIDDSENIIIDESGKADYGAWIAPRREGKTQDWYFFAYGHDYLQALQDAMLVFGRQPLPPRWTLGYWWSRYWPYSDTDLNELVEEFARNHIPLSVMVIDTDWHLPGWTGYTWDKAYFPEPQEFLARLHEQGIRVTLNLHPNEGVAKHEQQFPEVCKLFGQVPDKTECISFQCSDPRSIEAYFKLLLNPEEDRGVDFWWLDWPGGNCDEIKGLNPLPWMNRLHWEDMEKRGEKRPLIFSRYGGYGAGRYNIGFSGDTYATWETLAYQTYFTATAANVLFGYWSHDIGGFQNGRYEPELYMRWIQFGAFSPILRTHCNKTSGVERRVWKYPELYKRAMEEAIQLRQRLVPYIYSENRKAYDTGVSLCHPLYYHWPEQEQAYQHPQQYMFGSQMMVAPIVQPADTTSEMASKEIWLPDGPWYDVMRGCIEEGGKIISRKYLFQEIPIFVRPGSIIPGMYRNSRVDDMCYHSLSADLYPGSGRYELYEDDGVSQAYQNESSAVILIEQEESGTSKIVHVTRNRGDYDGFVLRRNLELRLPCTVPPVSVTVGAKALPYERRLADDADGWNYNGKTGTTVVQLNGIDLDPGCTVVITFADADANRFANGLRGVFSRLERVRSAGIALCFWQSLHSEERLAQELYSISSRIERSPENFAGELRAMFSLLPHLRKVVDVHGRLGADNKISSDRLAHRSRCLSLIDDIDLICMNNR